MGAPTSKSAICNLALDNLLQTNEETVTNIDSPNTQTEVVCARWYDTTRRALLRKHYWNFASKRVQLTASTTVPAFGYALAYNLPNDFLRLSRLQDANSFDPDYKIEYHIENGKILTNGSSGDTLNMVYIYDFTNVGAMDALFVNLFIVELALNMSYKFTTSNTNVQRLAALRDEMLQKAKSVDGQERPPYKVERSRSLRARRGTREINVFDDRYIFY